MKIHFSRALDRFLHPSEQIPSDKRPSPLASGHARSWACAIAYTVGSVNFLFDKSQTPHLRGDELFAWFGLSKSTGGNKSSQIKQILKIGLMDMQWTLPSRLEQNPMAWMISVNGLIMDPPIYDPHLLFQRVGRDIDI